MGSGGEHTDPVPARQSRGRGPRARALALMLGLVVGALLIEVLVRSFFDQPMLPLFVIDSGYGVRANEPLVRMRHRMPGDYDVTVTTNSAGMRGPREYSVAKPPGVKRVLILGDSFMFGFGVEDDEVASSVLERLLNERAGAVRYEVINLSVSGFGQAEELATYQMRGRAYTADIVVVAYFDNDVGNNIVAGLYDRVGEAAARRNARTFLPGVRAQELLYSLPPIRWLFEHSAAWNMVRKQLSAVVQKRLILRQGQQNYSDVQPESIALTRALLHQFVADIQADGAQAIIVRIPQPRGRTNFPMAPAEVVETGAVFVDTREFVTPEDYFARDGHWRPSGHRKAAERLATLILAKPWETPWRDGGAAGQNRPLGQELISRPRADHRGSER